ncbi:hypothetical protein BDW66DRAFT_164301 [Aspergillus desertorum]
MAKSAQLAKHLSARYPWSSPPLIVSAPMRGLSGPALATAVSRAGGLGFIASDAQFLFRDLNDASTLVNGESALCKAAPSSILPIGVGFQLWADRLDAAAAAIEKFQPCAAWLFAPRQQEDIATWMRRIRSVSPRTGIWVQIGTVAEAEGLVKRSADCPDVIVVQGAEAGGHGRADDGTGLISLLPEVADILARKRAEIPLVAAGGIADGRGAAAALCLGASGVAMGTRFLASKEAQIPRGYQQEILRASNGGVSTTRTRLYLTLTGSPGWPKVYSPRAIINRSFRDYQASRSRRVLKRLYDEAVKQGDAAWGPEGRAAAYAGASVGLIRDVKSAGDIVADVRKGAVERTGSWQD